jgi:hypothetical protein
MQWFRLDSGYPKFRENDRIIFYFWQYCTEDPDCFGMLEISNRGNGKSFRAGCAILEPTTRTKRVLSGIQSKTDDDAKEFFLTKVAEPFKDLPDFFQPQYNHGTDPRSELSFFLPAKKGRNAKQFKRDVDSELRSRIDFRSSKESAYDSATCLVLIQDEVGKKTNADVAERQRVNKLVVYRDGVMRGKQYNTTTIEEAEIEGGCKDIWYDSDQRKRNENNHTTSGLYRIFVPAYKCFGKYIDEWGYCDEEKAKQYFLNTRKAIKDSKKLASEIRKNPFTIEEAFMVSGEKCVFNALYLTKRQEELLAMEIGTKEEKASLPIQGDFAWVDGIDGEVEFVPNDVSGKFKLTRQYPKERTNRVRRYEEDGMVRFAPLNDFAFASGSDPIMHGQVVEEGRASNASAYVFEKFDVMQDDPNGDPDDWKSYNFCCQYIYRPEEPEEFIEDMIKMIRYFGCQIHVENQKNYILRYLRLRGYHDFIMARPENTKSENERYKKTQDSEGTPQTTPLIQQYTGMLQTFINHNWKRMMFKEQIADMLKFKPLKPREHDPTVASGFTILAAHKPVERMPDPIDIDDIFPTYDNSGTYSKLSA